MFNVRKYYLAFQGLLDFFLGNFNLDCLTIFLQASLRFLFIKWYFKHTSLDIPLR